MPSSSSNLSRILLAVALGALVWLIESWAGHSHLPATPPARPVAPTSPIGLNPAPPGHPAALPFVEAPASPLAEAWQSLQGVTDAATMQQRLAELRRTLAAMPTNAAVVAIRAFLDSKADAPTHLGFKVAGNGLLDNAPTLRTFLLDELARIDPVAAADYARIVLTSMDSPDEWAVALRNLARGDASDSARALLAEKAGDLLRNPAWQQDPSVGYLEAFDVPVFLGGTQFMPTLSDLVRQQDNPAVAHAAFLSLDRLVINDPATALAALQTDPGLLQGRAATRADYFARADVRNAQQRQIIENYLLNPGINPAELEAFAGIFPNANFMISANLLTQATTPDHASLADRDVESLRVIQAWQADPRFAKVQPALAKIEMRLQQFANQASQP
jgi:hypothetical protein